MAMFLPKLKILPIHPEENVQFIINYLSDEKRENNTRPFFEKTISLYPELKDIGTIENETIEFFLEAAYKVVCEYVEESK